jgi:hypothetical protein
MTLELGVYSFGNTPPAAGGGPGTTAQAIRNVLEAVRVAEQAGLDFFGFGEHHTPSMPLSSPTSLANAAAASTQRIGLGTTVTVLSTDDPLRVLQQLATAAAIAPGRVEVVAGRGSSDITFPLFDLDVRNYDMFYRSKLDLLIAANRNDRVTWNGPHRQRSLTDALIVPRPEQPLKIWLGTGGSPESVLRAAELGLPMFLGILGGTAEHWAQYGTAYRHAWAELGHPPIRPASPSQCTGSSPPTAGTPKPPTSNTSCACSPPAPPRSAAPGWHRPAGARTTNPAAWSSPADPTRSPTASCTCTNCSDTAARSCRWTLAACPTTCSSRALSCSAPKSCRRSARNSDSNDCQGTRLPGGSPERWNRPCRWSFARAGGRGPGLIGCAHLAAIRACSAPAGFRGAAPG